MRVDSSEPVWSINIKRGLINILQLNLQERDVIAEPEVDINYNHVPWEWSSGGLHRIFRTFEKDLVGDCETTYTIIDDGVINEELHVSKVRNYDHCQAKPAFYNGLLSVIKDANQRTSNVRDFPG